MFDYQSLKQLAKQIGRPVKDLVALSVGNDPFYAEVPHRRKEAEWFADIWDQFSFPHGIHLRRIHYTLLSKAKDGAPIITPTGKPYQNTDNDWSMLDRASLSARYLDMIPLDALVDRRNDAPHIFAPEPNLWGSTVSVIFDTPAAVEDLPTFPELPDYHWRERTQAQNYLVEVWIEKSTQNDWLVPLCRQHGVNLVVGVGELSEIASRGLVDRARESGKAARVIYISDFDPGGRSMPVAVARKAEFYIRKFDSNVDLSLNPLALTEEQCIDYELPRTPIKEKERRKDRFEERFGAIQISCWGSSLDGISFIESPQAGSQEAVHRGKSAHISPHFHFGGAGSLFGASLGYSGRAGL